MLRHTRCWLSLALCAALSAPCSARPPAGTSFTYQGELKSAGTPYTGSPAMTFRLYTQSGGGAPIGTVTLPSVAVAQGLFTASLDFGVSPFTSGQALWLEVETLGQMLSPRQQVSGTPFSLSTRGISVDGAGNVGVGGPAAGGSRLSVQGGVNVFDAVGQGVGFTTGHLALNRASNEDPAYEYDDTADTHTIWSGGGPSVTVNAFGAVNLAGSLTVGAPPGDASVQLPAASVSAAECADEAGLASVKLPDASISTFNSNVSIGSATINCPAAGYIVVMFSSTVDLAPIPINLRLRLDADAATEHLSVFHTRANTGVGVTTNLPVTVQTIYPASAGSHSVSVSADTISPSPSVNDFLRNRLTLIFVPTAYGTVQP